MPHPLRSAWMLLALAALTACAPKGPKPKTLELDSFERVPDPGLLKRQFDPAEALKKPTYPSHDFDVATSGYAELSAFNKDAARAANDKALYKFIQGKTAARVRFTVPQDYKKKGADDFPKVWESGFELSIDSHTPLKATDWSAYKYLSLRTFNPGPIPQTLYLRISDASSTVTTTAATVPLGEAELEFPLDYLSTARLNPRDIKSLTFYLDSAGQDKDPVLYVDGLALQDMDAALRAKLAADEGDTDTDEEDWDEEDSDTVRKVTVVRPGQSVEAPQALSGPASAQ